MVIGKHEPKKAANECWADAIRIMLDEATTALEESFCDLTDEQVRAYPLSGRHNIATMVMHCLQTADNHWVGFQTGNRLMTGAEQFDMWSHGPDELRVLQEQKGSPTVREMIEALRKVRDAALAGLEAATEDELRSDRAADGAKQKRGWTGAWLYFRSICHIMAHVRQIWCLRGMMGLVDEIHWPQQHYV